MGTNIARVAAVRDIAQRVTQGAIDKMTASGVDFDEDYADALEAVGELLKYVGTQLLHDVYKDDIGEDRRFWAVKLGTATHRAAEALTTLQSFDITTHDIDTLGE